LRYDEKLDLQVRSDVNHKERLIEPMLLIPILENAFKYSGLGIIDNAFVVFNVSEVDNKLIVFCRNSINPDQVKDDAGGIGLTNIKKRLEMAYMGNYTFSILQTDEVFTLKLSFPLV